MSTAGRFEPVDWGDGDTPRSARFGDIYHTRSGALQQAQHVFLQGCNLPAAWAGQQQWRILETGFGLGLNFLSAWLAWKNDPARPGILHFVSIEAHPVAAHDLLRAASAYGDLQPLAAQLASQWHGLLPGLHRLAFEDGHILLTLCVGDVQDMLRAQHFEADSIFLDGFSPQHNPDMWSPQVMRHITRFARRGTGIATWSVAGDVRQELAQNGFRVEKTPGLPPKRECLCGTYDPPWTPRQRAPRPQGVAQPGHCAVIGAGLAGAAVAASLARRGWRVTVVDRGEKPAAGASGAPAGVFAPHVSPDDAVLSRLTRAGIRATWQQLQQLMEDGDEWGSGGVIERRPETPRLPQGWPAQQDDDSMSESWIADAAQLRYSALPADTPALVHRRAGWVRLPHLVQHWLLTPGVAFRGSTHVAQLVPDENGNWLLAGDDGLVLLEADRVVVAAGFHSAGLLPGLTLQAVRGQLAWGRMGGANGPALPTLALNGNGHLITHIGDVDEPIWLTGSTYGRGDEDPAPRDSETQANLQRLRSLHPAVAQALENAFARGQVHAWAGTRCASRDRRPLLGEFDPQDMPGVWLCTALGSRGLSLAALCGEILAAHWHAEPLPVAASLARALDVSRPGACPAS